MRRNKVKRVAWGRKVKEMDRLARTGRRRIKELLCCPISKRDELSGVRQAAWRFRKSLPLNPSKRTAVLEEVNRVENKKVRKKLQFQEESSSLTQSVLAMTKFKAKNQIDKVDQIAKQIKKKYKSLREAHRNFGKLSWKRWHSICKPKKEKHILRSVTNAEKEEILSIWNSPEVTVVLPFKRYAKKKFMIVTIVDAYQKYIRIKKSQKKNCHRILSLSSFYRLKPKNVKTRRCLPLNQCTCSACGNFSLNREALIANGIKGVPKKSSTAACALLCPNNTESCDIKDYKRECIYKECDNCTHDVLVQKIKEINPQANWQKKTTWHQWEYVKKTVNNKECSGFERIKYTGTLLELLDHYIAQSQSMPEHILTLDWQRKMYVTNRDELQDGDVQMVIDYAKNYAHVSQDESQSAHWDRRQSTLHPISITYPCPEDKCDERVTDEVVCISPDLKHDVHGVEQFIQKAVEHLIKDKVPVKRIFEWSDNCTGQYKSRFSFSQIAMSKIPRQRNFYGENHGKSAADGIIGRLKMHLDVEIKIGNVIDNPESLYNHCIKKLATEKVSGCQHYRTNFIYCPEIIRPERSEDVKPVKQIKKQHCVRTTGKIGLLEVRQLSCFCDGCSKGTRCSNDNIVMPWTKIFLTQRNKKLNDHKSHWIECNTKTKAVSKKETKFKLEPKVEKAQICPSRPSHPMPNVMEQWEQVASELEACATYKELKAKVDKVKLPCRIPKEINSFPCNTLQSDSLSIAIYPKDAPVGCTPIKIYGDGNCFTRSISVICYGHANNHRQIRAMLVCEGVKNKKHYLDNDYLNFEGKYEANLVEYFSIISEAYNAVVCDRQWNCHTMEKIYEHEVFQLKMPGQYCSMWQLYQASNIIGRPIYSIFPTGNMEEFRSRSNRMIYTINYSFRDKDPVAIMWTKTNRKIANPNHFVPVVKV